MPHRPPPRSLHRRLSLPRAALIGSLLAALALPASAASPAAAALRLASPVALVQNLDSGHTPLARGLGGAPRSIASITKLMTAMVVLDDGQPLTELLDVGPDDVDTVKNTRSRLQRLHLLTREELLTAALLSSDNMAALALARHGKGGRQAFVQRMNAKARSLGLTGTHFVDPAGLAPENRATAAEITRLLSAASGYPFIRHATTQPEAHIRGLAYRNTNPWAADPLWGISLSKTGFTAPAIWRRSASGCCSSMAHRCMRWRATARRAERVRGNPRPALRPGFDSSGAQRPGSAKSGLRKWLIWRDSWGLIARKCLDTWIASGALILLGESAYDWAHVPA